MVAASPLLTRIIRDGAMVEIDGDTGTVTILSSARLAAAASPEPFLTTCRLFRRRCFCSFLEHLLIISCASRNPGSSS
jgi:hypothetical protein